MSYEGNTLYKVRYILLINKVKTNKHQLSAPFISVDIYGKHSLAHRFCYYNWHSQFEAKFDDD